MHVWVQVSARAKKRGLPQMGTLGAGNHYAEVQVVDEVFDQAAARKMGIDTVGQVRQQEQRDTGGGGERVCVWMVCVVKSWCSGWCLVEDDDHVLCCTSCMLSHVL